MSTQPAFQTTEQDQGWHTSPQDDAPEGDTQPSRVGSVERLSIAVHDMRNYLTPMRMRADLLLRRAAREHREADIRDLAALDKAIERLHLLVSNLVEGARLVSRTGSTC